MPRRDPSTGKFVSGQSIDDVEYVSFYQVLSLGANDLGGATDEFYAEEVNFEGVELYDMDKVIDRHEVGELIHAQHRLAIQPTGTQTADSAAYASVEISSSPARKLPVRLGPTALNDIPDTDGITGLAGHTETDESLDLLGRVLSAMSQGPFTDGTTGTGGGGAAGHDEVDFDPIDWSMDRRDEVYINGTIGAQNVADGPIGAIVTGQHVYSVAED